MDDLGYSLAIPWNDVYNTGWLNYSDDINPPIKMWGAENQIVVRDDPEFHAPGDLIRSTGGLPAINLNDPKYEFSREEYTFKAF